jgi:hypothetical protein
LLEEAFVISQLAATLVTQGCQRFNFYFSFNRFKPLQEVFTPLL